MSVAARRSHRGDEYQIVVASHWVAQLLLNDAIDSVRIDAVALPADGDTLRVDDIVVGYRDGSWRFIQAKKNQTNHNAWTLTDAVLRHELCKARDQLEAQPSGWVEFCSRTPFGELAKLLEGAADYPDYLAFANNAPQTLTEPLGRVAAIFARDEESAFALLRRIEIGPHHDYEDWTALIRACLEPQVTDVETAVDVIARLVRDQQSGLKARADSLRRDDVLRALEARGVLPLPDSTEDEDVAAFADASRIGRHWRRTIGGERIQRPELQQLIDLAGSQDPGTVLLTDGPGTGKTCLLLDFADYVEQQTDWCLLFIKGDLFADCGTEGALAATGLPPDLVARAARLARQRRVVVVIDSLDVLALQREHRSLRLFLALLDRLERVQNVCVVTACRSFDLQYDPLLRERRWDKKLRLQPLDFPTVVEPLLTGKGIATERLTAEVKSLLTVPEHLRLLVETVAGGADIDGLATLRSVHQLQALYLEEVVRRDHLLGDEALIALERMAAQMLHERKLHLPWASVQLDLPRLQRLISQGVLSEPEMRSTGQGIAFGHQTLLDALAVRAALAEGQTLEAFIRSHPPFPFLRPVVRSFAMHLRATDAPTFRRQLRAAIDNPDIAYHLKRLLIESLAILSEASTCFTCRNGWHRPHAVTRDRHCGCWRGSPPSWKSSTVIEFGWMTKRWSQPCWKSSVKQTTAMTRIGFVGLSHCKTVS